MYVVVAGGDLILAVGPKRTMIQVSADLLRTASPIFRSILQHHFEDGSFVIEEGGPVELPDDNPRALLHALRVLHVPDTAMEQLSGGEIQDLAMLVDKYKMASHFKFAGAYWMRLVPDDNEECWLLTTAAIWLRLRTSFFEFTKELAKRKDPMLLRYANNTPDRALGLRLRMAIQQLRIKGTNTGMGLCLDCFLTAGVDLIGPRPNCGFPYRHLK